MCVYYTYTPGSQINIQLVSIAVTQFDSDKLCYSYENN